MSKHKKQKGNLMTDYRKFKLSTGCPHADTCQAAPGFCPKDKTLNRKQLADAKLICRVNKMDRANFPFLDKETPDG